MSENKYKAILTFDDGPIDEKERGRALDLILKALKNRATGVFYVVGKEVKSRPDLARRIVDEGHIIQNHSWAHKSLPGMTEAALTKDLRDTQDIIFSTTGRMPDRLRPPYGAGWVDVKSKRLIRVANKLELKLTGWDIDTYDWKKSNKGLEPRFYVPPRRRWEKLYELGNRPLDILMHVKTVTALKLDEFMTALMAEGWCFTTYDEQGGLGERRRAQGGGEGDRGPETTRGKPGVRGCA